MTQQALVVDDQMLVLELAESALTAAGYAVHVARDWHEALACIDATTPDLILLDIMLPERDGIDIYREVRGRGHLASVPILFMSAGLEEMPHGIQSENDPCVDFMPKPFGPHELQTALERLLARARGLGST